jgi:hypothetical protein
MNKILEVYSVAQYLLKVEYKIETFIKSLQQDYWKTRHETLKIIIEKSQTLLSELEKYEVQLLQCIADLSVSQLLEKTREIISFETKYIEHLSLYKEYLSALPFFNAPI